jgi:hypothetical protein
MTHTKYKALRIRYAILELKAQLLELELIAYRELSR